MIYVLLLLSIIIALIGIANTLSLSIHERTRELGLLRAVGMDRRQMRSIVRWEAVMISVLGALVGLGLGPRPQLGRCRGLGSQGPGPVRGAPGPLVVIMVVAALARGARLDPPGPPGGAAPGARGHRRVE